MIFEINHELIKNQHTVVFYNQNALFDVTSINGYKDEVTGVAENARLMREYSYSFDKNNWASYQTLNTASLQQLPVDRFLFFRFKYTRVGDSIDVIKINNFELEVTYKDKVKPCNTKPVIVPITDPANSFLCGIQIPAIDINNSMSCIPEVQFNIHDLTKGNNMQQMLNMFINKNLVGTEVLYFRTGPDKSTTDSFLGEYSLNGVVESKCLNIVLIDNELPSNKPKFDDFGLGFDVFEVNIDYFYFQQIFGKGVHPRDEDYIHLKVANMLYYVNSHYLEKGMNGTQTYWVLSLKKYDEDMAMRKPKEVKDYIANITTTREELFGEKEREEQEDILNTKQSSRLTIAKDEVREFIDEDVVIIPYELNNNGTPVSQHYYDFSFTFSDVVGVRYKSKLDLLKYKATTITMWLNFVEPEELDDDVYFNIISSEIIDRYKLKIALNIPLVNLGLKKNDFIISLDEVTVYHILEVTSSEIIVSRQLNIDDIVIGQFRKAAKNNIIKSYKDNSGFRIDLLDRKFFIIHINKKYVKLSVNQLAYNNWYGFVFGLSCEFSSISLFVYQMADRFDDKDTRFSTRLDLVSKLTAKFDDKNLEGATEQSVEMITSNIKMTNFRLWDHLISEDHHSIVLNSSFVRNSSKAIIIDNATDNLNIAEVGDQV